MKRNIPNEELLSVIMAFGIYYLGFFFLDYYTGLDSNIMIITGLFLFIIGSLVNLISENQRNQWKNNKENHGKIFDKGLFSISRHPNYFGDLVWVLGYATVSGSYWSFSFPVLLLIFFQFYNIPLQERHMLKKYGEQYTEYLKKVKGFIPFIL
jgi:protein-S-isoprenylcysteine O-methyltransferase Ste14